MFCDTNSIVQVASAFEIDHDPHKINLGLIGFREDSGRIFVPPTTRQVSRCGIEVKIDTERFPID